MAGMGELTEGGGKWWSSKSCLVDLGFVVLLVDGFYVALSTLEFDVRIKFSICCRILTMRMAMAGTRIFE